MNRQAQANDIIEDGGFAFDSEVVEVGTAGSDCVDIVDDVSNKIAPLLLRRRSRLEAGGAFAYDVV